MTSERLLLSAVADWLRILPSYVDVAGVRHVTTDATRSGERFPAAGVVMLAKPFSLADLAGAVRGILDAPSVASRN